MKTAPMHFPKKSWLPFSRRPSDVLWNALACRRLRALKRRGVDGSEAFYAAAAYADSFGLEAEPESSRLKMAPEQWFAYQHADRLEKLRIERAEFSDPFHDPEFLARLAEEEANLEPFFAPLRESIRQCAILTGADMATRVA